MIVTIIFLLLPKGDNFREFESHFKKTHSN